MEDSQKQEALKALIKKLKDPSPDVRQEALKEAVNAADTRVLEAVKNLLSDSNPAVRYYAKKTFASVSAQISSRAMIEAEERRAREALESAPVEAPKDAQGADFMPADVREKIKYIQSLPDEPDESQLNALYSELSMDADKYVLATVIKKLGKTGGNETVSRLVPFLSHSDPRVIANTVEAIDETGSEEGISAMLDLLSHEDNRVKGNIAKALYKYLEKDRITKSLILDKLSTMLNSKEPWTQDSAIYALGVIGNDSALQILTSYRGQAESVIGGKIADAILKIRKKLDPDFEEKEKKAKLAAQKVIAGIDESVKSGRELSAGTPVASAAAEKMRSIAASIWSADDSLRKNLTRAAAAFIACVMGLFVLTVAVNVLYFLAFGLPPAEIPADGQSASRPATGAGNADEIVFGMLSAGKFDAAISAVRAAKKGPVYNDAERAALDLAYSKKVEFMLAKNDAAGAIAAIADWAGDNSSSTLACVLKGQIELRNLGRPADAAASFAAALGLDPACVEAKVGAADCAYYSGKFDESLRLYEASGAKGTPFEFAAVFGAANSKAAKGDVTGAEAAYNDCLKLKPDYYICRIGLAKVARLSKKFDRAREEIGRVLAVDPNLPRASFELGEIMRDSGATAEALVYYRRAMNLEPGNSMYRIPYINITFGLGIYQGLDELIKAELAQNPKNADLLMKLGTVQYSLHYSSAALATFEKYVAEFGDAAAAHYYIALVREEMGETDAAIESYKKAIVADDHHLPSYINLTNLYLNAKKSYNNVEITADLGMSNCGNQPALLFNKALALYFQNETLQALMLLKAVENSGDRFLSNEAKKLGDDIRSRATPKNQKPQQPAGQKPPVPKR